MQNDFYALYTIGQVIHHRLYDYRGVIIDVDATYQGTDEWYKKMAGTRPPRNEPWYHVLVDDSDYGAYVAERNLELDDSGDPITHPQLDTYFDKFVEEDGNYISSHLNS